MTVVCILGMHRSGSSLLAQVLAGNGYRFGDQLVAAAPSNPVGHFEDRFVVDTNKRILTRFGGTWDRPPVLPPDWMDDRVVQRELTRARRYRDDEVATRLPFAFKDPRVCLVLPFWMEAFGPMKFVVTVRGRAEVTRSVVNRHEEWLAPDMRWWRFKRNLAHRARRAYEPLRPIAAEQADALWSRYYEDAIAATEPDPVVMVHCERLLQDPTTEITRILSELGGDVDGEVDTSMVRPALSSGPSHGEITAEALAIEERFRSR